MSNITRYQGDADRQLVEHDGDFYLVEGDRIIPLTVQPAAPHDNGFRDYLGLIGLVAASFAGLLITIKILYPPQPPAPVLIQPAPPPAVNVNPNCSLFCGLEGN
jgi:hypothetical protein